MNYESVTTADFMNVLRHVSDPVPKCVLLTLNYGRAPHVTKEPKAFPARYKILTLEVDGRDVDVVIGTDNPPQVFPS